MHTQKNSLLRTGSSDNVPLGVKVYYPFNRIFRKKGKVKVQDLPYITTS